MDRLGMYLKSGMRRMFSGIMLSRLSGLGRDFAMAHAFGDHPIVAAFFVAFRFAHLFRRFFGEGPLQSAFIPHFEELKQKDPQKAFVFFQKLTLIIGGLVCGLIGIIQIGIWVTFPMWTVDNQHILLILKWILPSLFFISLYGLNLSFLQCHNQFFIPHVAPVLCNGIWVIGALTLKHLPSTQAMVGLAKCVTVGSIIQWMLTCFPMLRTLGHQTWNVRAIFNPEVKQLAKRFGLGMIGVGALQLNTCLDVIFSRCSHLSAPVYLWYASRFQQLAFALFGITVVNTLVPLISRAIKQGESTLAKEIFSFGSRRMVFMMVSMTFAIGCFSVAAIDLVFGGGQFTSQAVRQTANCLITYSLGLLPATLILYDSAIFYAQGNFKTPTYVSLLTICVHLALNTFFIFILGLGPISTALSTSLSAWGNGLILRSILSRKGWTIGLKWKETVCLLGVLGLAAVCTHQVGVVFSNTMYRLFIPGGIFLIFLGLCAPLFRKSFFNNASTKTSLFVVKDH